MNRENAIQCLQVMKGAECINALSAAFPEHYGVENIKALETAIKALEIMPEYERLKERDRAKKPYRTDTLPHWLCCPNCRLKQTIEGMEFSKDVIEASQFCSRCGQRIDWSMEEEHES